MSSWDKQCEKEGLPDALPGNLIDNRYKVGRYLGKGGFGFVYEARHEVLGHPIRRVAFKLLKKPNLKQEDASRDFRDVLAVAHLAETHAGHAYVQHLVQIYDAGICERWDRRGYVVMEYVQGDLQHEIRPGKAFPIRLALDYTRQICSAMSLAHGLENPVLHRDLKPPNVLISHTGLAKVTDFGLARAVGSVTGLAEGAGDYFCQAPESLEGVCSPASDVYSIGLMLYQMLTGHHPFDDLLKQHDPDRPAGEHLDIHKQRRQQDITEATRLNAELRFHPDLHEVLDTCLRYYASDRYPSAVALLAALEEVGRERHGPARPAHGPRDGEPAQTPLFLLQQATLAEQRKEYEAALHFLECLRGQADPYQQRTYLGEALYLSGKIKAEQGHLKQAQEDLFYAWRDYGHAAAAQLRKDLLRSRRKA